MKNFENIRSNWKIPLSASEFRIKFIISIIFLASALFVYRKFLDFAEARQGVRISDPILNLFEPVNLTWLISHLTFRRGVVL